MNYQERITKMNPLTFNAIIAGAWEALPENCRRAPWIGLEHGVEPLDTEQKLDQYLAAYGKMHVEKIRMALSALENPQQEFKNPVTVVDWGCGQALATCSLFDWMDEQGVPRSQIGMVRLIEPSKLALDRAVMNVDAYLGTGHVLPMNTKICDLTEGGFRADNPSDVTIHLFSNVLDIETIDIDALSDLVKKSFKGRQIFCCVSPLNLGSARIQEFAKRFGISEDNILKSAKGHLTGGRGTVSLIVFIVENAKPSVIKAEFAPRFIQDVQTQDSMVLQRILKNHKPAQSVVGKLVQFYRMVTELEQIKEPSTKQVVSFPCTETNGVLEVDVTKSKDFLDAFKKNADPSQTKWRKDLLVGIDVLFGEKAYRLLYCIIPFEELKAIDVSRQAISVPLRSFFVSLGCSESLELSTEQVEKLEVGVKDPAVTWAGLSKLVEEVVGSGATLMARQVQIAFSDKNLALAQIYSELRTLDERWDVSSVPLLKDLLENAEFKNEVDQVQEDKLIRVVPMDEKQQQAVAAILNNRVSVVTGPPGCGKTQLILNLMANALIRGKSVLVASKNNKAVDNVKDRFAEFDLHGCCQRFGSKKQLTDVAAPHLGELLNLSQNSDLQEVSHVHSEICARYNALCGTLDEEYRNLTARDALRSCVEEDGQKETDIKDELEKERMSVWNSVDGFESSHLAEKNCDQLSQSDVEAIYKKLYCLSNYTALRFSGISGMFARLFSRAKIASEVLNEIALLPEPLVSLIDKANGRKNIRDFTTSSEIVDYCTSVVGTLDSLRQYRKELLDLKQDGKHRVKSVEERLSSFQAEASNRRTELERLEAHGIENKIAETKESLASLELGRSLVSATLDYNLVANDAARVISAYRAYLPDNIPWKQEELPQFEKVTKRFLDVFKLTTVTSLSVKSSFPLKRELFDILVVDEASQCDVASALPLILRAKQVVVIGDPKQLRHISGVETEEELAIKAHLGLVGAVHLKYADCSLWDYFRSWIVWSDRNNAPLVLDRHYRCHPEIIGYSNEMFYADIAIGGLQVCTKTAAFGLPKTGIFWNDVKGKQLSDSVNVNLVEVNQAISLAKQYVNAYPLLKIGIVTPFAAQAERLNAAIPNEIRDRIVADTVHKFQGDERDVMIYSLVVTDNSPDGKIRWVDYRVPNLVNVAVTRAKSLLIIVGNRSYVKAHSHKNLPLGHLESYISGLGK